MSDTFTASNGSKVRLVGGELGIGDPPLAPLTDKGVVALREFFQHERDKELGRWRWPEKPDYVVYPSELYLTPPNVDLVTVFNERTGQSAHCRREDEGNSGHFSFAARAYFAAPLEPKPWHAAKEGEVWVMTSISSHEAACVVDRIAGELFFSSCVGGSLTRVTGEITTARRIWPEATHDQVGAA